MQLKLGRNRVLHALAASPLVPFVKKHETAEEVVVLAVSVNILIATLFGAGVASAAIVGANMIDLSNNNGASAAAAISAPYVQAVEAKATEGLAFRDADYPIFRAAARTHAKAFGGYFFLHPGESGKAQADYFIAYARPVKGNIEPVVDSEIGSPCSAAPQTLSALHELTAKGYHPILYSNAYWLSQFAKCAPGLEHYPVWEAEYGPVLTLVPGFHVIAWQFTDRSSVEGHLVDGSHLMVRSIAQLEIGTTLTPAQIAARKLAARKAALRAMSGGYFLWFEWREARGPFKGLQPAEKDVRPNVRHRIPDAWWTRLAAQVAGEQHS